MIIINNEKRERELGLGRRGVVVVVRKLNRIHLKKKRKIYKRQSIYIHTNILPNGKKSK